MEIIVDAPHLVPEYQTAGSAAVDLRAYMDEDIYLNPGDRVSVGTGVRINLPQGVAGLILPRSGLGSRGLTIGNTPGLIDSDYQGTITLALWNSGPTVIHIQPGDRVAQLLFMPVMWMEFDVVTEFSRTTERGSNGFGSTGLV